jgi:putative hydrolase of HD superfamily
MSRLKQQIEFIAAADRLKSVSRRTMPIGLDRRENSAEHSWQAILAALVLSEHSNTEIDVPKVLKMLLVHDLPEIFTNDTFHYSKQSSNESYDIELEAARSIFSSLPVDQQNEFLDLWREFEERQTAEARYAASIDRLMAFILNPRNDGGSWKEFQVTAEAAVSKNSQIREGADPLWQYVREVIDDSVLKGFLKGPL